MSIHASVLSHDISTLLQQVQARRQALRWLAGAGAGALVGCGGGGDPASSTASGGDSSSGSGSGFVLSVAE